MTRTFHKLALVLSGASLLTSLVPATSACDRGPRLAFRPVYAHPYQQRVYTRPQVAYPQPIPQIGVVPGQTAPVGVTIQPGQPGLPLAGGQPADTAALGALAAPGGQPAGQLPTGAPNPFAGGGPSPTSAPNPLAAGGQAPTGTPNQFAAGGQMTAVGQMTAGNPAAAMQTRAGAAAPQLRTAQTQTQFAQSPGAVSGGQAVAGRAAPRTAAPGGVNSPAAPQFAPGGGGNSTAAAMPSGGAAPPQTSPPAAGRSAEALALEALAGLGGAEQAAPAPAAPQSAPQAASPAEQPAASGDSLPQAPQNAGLQGQFTAAVGNGATIRLSLGSDGSFVWVATKEGKSSNFQGTFSISGGSLTLHRASDNQKLEGTITLTENGFSLRFAGQGVQNGQSAQQASSLNFVRA